MMHVTGDGKRMYVTNPLLSTLDHAPVASTSGWSTLGRTA